MTHPATASPTLSPTLSRRNALVLDHTVLVRAIAARIQASLPVHVELDDLVHAGMLGLLDAATRYNGDRMVSFSSYAKHRIHGAILDSLRQQDMASRGLRRRHKQAEEAMRELLRELHRAPTEDEVAARLGVEVERLRRWRSDLHTVGVLSAPSRDTEQEDRAALEPPTPIEDAPEYKARETQLRQALGRAKQVLPSRYQAVVTMYYDDQMTMREIGIQLGINESRVSQIHTSALVRLNSALRAVGIHSAGAFC